MGKQDDRGAAPAEEFGPMDTRAIRTAIDDQAISAAALAEAIFRKMRQSVVPPADHHRKLFGLGLGEWVKIGIFLAGVAGAAWAWSGRVDDGLKARPTKEEVEKAIHLHAATPGQHEGLETEVRTTRESQIRMEERQENQVEALKQINASLREIKITVRR